MKTYPRLRIRKNDMGDWTVDLVTAAFPAGGYPTRLAAFRSFFLACLYAGRYVDGKRKPASTGGL